MRKIMWVFSVLVLSSQLLGQMVTDPLPYAAIANPLPDTMNQLYRDSVNLKISPIRINQAGYRPQDDKYFYYVASSGAPSGFKVIDNAGATVGTGTFTSTSNTSSGQFHIKASNNAQLVTGGDTRYIMDSKVSSGTIYLGQLPTLSPGTYRVVVGSDISADFVINEKVYSWVRDALLKFYGVNRCGDDNSWFHPPCHLKDAVVGGWHDCGDHLKEGITMGHTAAVLGLAAAVFQDRDQDVYSANQGKTLVTDGIPDILYEAKHGADFILSSYDKAGGQVAKMITSVANFGNDHMWWGRPEYQDKMPTVRGGPVREARNEVGANILSDYAVNLALLSKVFKVYDSAYASRCLKAARDLYAYAKNNQKGTETAAYNGCAISNDELAFAATALIWATGERKYLDDLCYDKIVGTKGNLTFPKFSFEGGWFANQNVDFNHGSPANTDWASVHVYALWGFFRLVLMDDALCTTLGLTDQQRKPLIEKTAYNVISNLGHIGIGDQTIVLPAHGGWAPNNIKYELPWMTMATQQEWVWNRYQSGNITEMYCYYDIATKIQGMELPNTSASTDWKAGEVKKVLIRQLDYMLGVNPWDISMIYGVGDKNYNHPHHRAANPEGKNVAGAFYKYTPPVGALQGGYKPSAAANLYSEHYDDYRHSETGIDGTSAIFLPVAGLAKEEVLSDPTATVRTIYVGCDNAIIEIRQSRYGHSIVQYGTGKTPDQTKTSDSADVLHRIELKGLKNGTLYNFNVKVSDLFGRESVIMNIDEDKNPVLFSFTTLQTCPSNAEISKVKICKVTSDSAEVFWYTPNGEFDSKIIYGTSKPPATIQSGDVSGHPVKFHYMKIGGLKEQTTYYFSVQSGTSVDDKDGEYYQFTTPVEHVNFDLRALRYTWSDMTALGMNIINQDQKSYDSLDIRLYFRAKDDPATNYKFEYDLAARLDIGIVYDESGFQKAFGENSTIRNNISSQKPVKMEDTYNEADGTYAYYLSIPLWGVEMKSGSRIRIDVLFDRRSQYPPYEDLMNGAPVHKLDNNDWSFGRHSIANGDPVDFPGIPEGGKNDVDNSYWTLPINSYMTVYRKGEFVWGYSPSKVEQSTKKTYYEMTSQVTSPLNNPSDDYFYTPNAVVVVEGHAAIIPVDGKINDIWVNGVALANVSSYVTWNANKQWYDFSIPAKLKNGRNPIDITLFGGPSESCVDCYGCTNSTHSFYVESGAQLYPSTISLKDKSLNPLQNDTAHIDTTIFHVVVTDRNGNLKGKLKDSLYVTVKNPSASDSIRVKLMETGDSTGIFQTVTQISVVDLPASQTGTDQISMTGGDKIWITYRDPTDPTDSSEATLVSKANFPVANNGALFDSNGDGAIDRMVINYSIPLKITPDSASFGIPVSTDLHVVRSTTDNFKVNGNTLEIIFTTPLDKGITGFASGTKINNAKSYLTNQNSTKTSVFTLYDSIGPIITSPVILPEKTGSGDDTLTVTFSELINLDVNVDSVLMVRHDGKSFGVAVLAIIEQNSRTMKLLVRSAGITLQDGDSLYINPIGTVTDAAKNHAHINNPRMPLVLKEAVPKVVSAFYTADKEGMIDKVEITFAKKINPADVSFGFKWNNNSTRVNVTNSNVSSSGSDGTNVVVFVNGLFTGSQRVTSGRMELIAIHSAFPKDTLKADVFDHAAPVILSAFLAPSPVKNGNYYVDTLTVTFSEPVENVRFEQPFNFKSMPNKTAYSMKMENSFNGEPTKQIFIISSYIDIEFPGVADSIRIDVNGTISDKFGNVQKVVENHFALMTAKSIPFSVTMKSGPNPFTPGTEPLNFADYDEALKAAHENKGSLIVLSPDTSRIKRQVSINGTIKIFDAFGSTVRKEDFVSNTAKTLVFFFWDGRNKSGRFVGSGTYVAVITVQNEEGQVEKKKLMIGVKR